MSKILDHERWKVFGVIVHSWSTVAKDVLVKPSPEVFRTLERLRTTHELAFKSPSGQRSRLVQVDGIGCHREQGIHGHVATLLAVGGLAAKSVVEEPVISILLDEQEGEDPEEDTAGVL